MIRGMSEEPFSPVAFDIRNATWGAALISWLFSGHAACLFVPTLFAAIAVLLCNILSIDLILGTSCAAAVIPLFILVRIYRNGEPDSDAP
jgi:hypothetical protein